MGHECSAAATKQASSAHTDTDRPSEPTEALVQSHSFILSHAEHKIML